MRKLSELLAMYRTDRPDEWTMDEFKRAADALEAENARLRAEIDAANAQEPELFAAYGDSNGAVILELFGFDEKECKNKILNLARSEGYKGTLSGYLMRKSWEVRPLYARPIPAQAIEPPCLCLSIPFFPDRARPRCKMRASRKRRAAPRSAAAPRPDSPPPLPDRAPADSVRA